MAGIFQLKVEQPVIHHHLHRDGVDSKHYLREKDGQLKKFDDDTSRSNITSCSQLSLNLVEKNENAILPNEQAQEQPMQEEAPPIQAEQPEQPEQHDEHPPGKGPGKGRGRGKNNNNNYNNNIDNVQNIAAIQALQNAMAAKVVDSAILRQQEEQLRKEREIAQNVADWHLFATVMDRLFFLSFVVIICCFLYIFFPTPHDLTHAGEDGH